MTGDERRLRFDPHVHTDASHDAVGAVETVLERAQDRGLDAVAITDHDTTAGARRALDLRDRFDLVVVPGVEISTADGHLLALGVVEDPPVGEPFATTVEWVRARDGLAIAPHPFQRSRHGVGKRALTDCDGVEVFNAWTVTGFRNRRAGTFARRNGYPGLGASDAHRPEMVGTAATEVAVDATDCPAGLLLDGIARGDCRPVGETATIAESLRTAGRVLGAWAGPRRQQPDDATTSG